MPPRTILQIDDHGQRTWSATTLDRLDKPELFLEEAIANCPALLGLENRRSGIRGPFQVFRQVSLPTPTRRVIYPDIVMFSASGHVIGIEVKLASNSELRDRAVIAQIIDYASAFTQIDPEQLVDVFARGSELTVDSWTNLVHHWFPAETDGDELAAVLRERLKSGEINLVIACDKIPAGLPETVAGIASQRSLGFDLDLVEIVPYVCSESPGTLILIPSTRLATEIVARTAVTITHQTGDAPPSTKVEVTSIHEILEEASAARSGARRWTAEETEAAFREHKDPTEIQLLEFAKAHSAGGKYVSEALKSNATISFFVDASPRGGSRQMCLLYQVLGWGGSTFFLDRSLQFLSADAGRELKQRLASIFGNSIDLSAKEPSMPLEMIGEHPDDFFGMLMWLTREFAGGSP